MSRERSIRILIIATLLSALTGMELLAQHADPASKGAIMALKVERLTAAERDALTLELSRTGMGRVVFACVPAGILVIEPNVQTDRRTLREHALPLLQRAERGAEVKEMNLSLAQAELRCSEARMR